MRFPAGSFFTSIEVLADCGVCRITMRTRPMLTRRERTTMPVTPEGDASVPTSPRVRGPAIHYSFDDLKESWSYLAVRGCIGMCDDIVP